MYKNRFSIYFSTTESTGTNDTFYEIKTTDPSIRYHQNDILNEVAITTESTTTESTTTTTESTTTTTESTTTTAPPESSEDQVSGFFNNVREEAKPVEDFVGEYTKPVEDIFGRKKR